MKKPGIRLVFLLLLLLPAFAFADTLRVTYLDVGQGDAALVQCGGQSMLIDTGSVESRDALLSFLDETGVIALDYVVGTSPKDEHIGGMASVLTKYDTQAIWMPRVRNETRAFEEALLTIRQTGHLIDPPVVTNQFLLGDAIVTILAPISEVYESLDDYSIVIRIDHGQNRFLFTGDAGQVSIDEMLASKTDLSANVLQVSSHGASISNSSAFFTSVSPSIAIISCAAEYGPAGSTLDALEQVGAMVLRTDEIGNIQIESDRTTLFYDELPALGEVEWYGRINTRNVNVRKGPSKSTDRIAYFDEGSAIRVLLTIENENGEIWYYVEMNGIQGYVRSDFVDPVNPVAQEVTEGEEEVETSDGLDQYFMPKSSSSVVLPTQAPVEDENAAPATPVPTIPLPGASTVSPIVLPQSTAQATQAEYVGNALSMIFHKSNCESLPSQKNRVLFSTRSDAIAAEYIPCLACNP